jgi:hypothetical protein
MFHGEILDFADYFVGREAAAFAADKGDNTERAAVVAAVLDF